MNQIHIFTKEWPHRKHKLHKRIQKIKTKKEKRREGEEEEEGEGEEKIKCFRPSQGQVDWWFIKSLST